jgi:hypothetical protein
MKIIITMTLLMGTLFAELKVGDRFPNLLLVDQFEEKIEIPIRGDFTVMVSFEKSISLGIKEFLERQERNFLVEHNISYISDVSSVPYFLMSWIVLPKFKKYPFRMGLIYDDRGEELNQQEEKVSLFSLKEGQVVGIEFIEVLMLQDALTRNTMR